MTWESHSRHGSNADPARIMALAAEFLGARTDKAPSSGRYSDLTLKGAVGQLLVERGMQVTLQVLGTDETCASATRRRQHHLGHSQIVRSPSLLIL
jgi:hypothetical protein